MQNKALDNQLMVNNFANKLLDIKKERHLTWAEIGSGAGVSPQAACKWGKGGAIDDAALERLSAYFGISKSELKFGDEVSKMRKPGFIQGDDWESVSEKKQEIINIIMMSNISDEAIRMLASVLNLTTANIQPENTSTVKTITLTGQPLPPSDPMKEWKDRRGIERRQENIRQGVNRRNFGRRKDD